MPILNEKSSRTCSATTSKGKQCRAYAVAGSDYCFTHSPAHARVRAAARRRGGKNRPHPSNTIPFPETGVTTARGLAAFVAQLIQDTWQLKPSLTRARTLAYLVKVQNEMIQRAQFEAHFRPLAERNAGRASEP